MKLDFLSKSAALSFTRKLILSLTKINFHTSVHLMTGLVRRGTS